MFKDGVQFEQVSCKEIESLADSVKAVFTAFHSCGQGNKGRKIIGMGSSWSHWPHSIPNLLVLDLVQGLASGVDRRTTLSVKAQKVRGCPVGSFEHGVSILSRQQ